MKQTVVAIHQPNFFPWLGYFDKIARCDRFIFLDHVQLPGGGGSWVNRVKLIIAGEPKWATAPVIRESLEQTIAQTKFDDRVPWRRKLQATILSSYGKAAHFDEAFDLLRPLIESRHECVADYNIEVVTRIAGALGINTRKMGKSSDMDPRGAATELLLDLTLKAGGDAYLRGGGASGYHDDDVLQAGGIEPLVQLFEHPVYEQRGSSGAFVPGLSIIDALMNVGIERTASLLHREEGS